MKGRYIRVNVTLILELEEPTDNVPSFSEQKVVDAAAEAAVASMGVDAAILLPGGFVRAHFTNLPRGFASKFGHKKAVSDAGAG